MTETRTRDGSLDLAIAADLAGVGGTWIPVRDGRPRWSTVEDWFTEDLAQARESRRRIAALDFAVACFGHGRPLDKEASLRLRRFAERLR